MDRVLRSLRVARLPLLVGYDALVWFVALSVAAVSLHAGAGADTSLPALIGVWALVTCLHTAIGVVVGDVRRRAPLGGSVDALLVGAVAFTAGFWVAIVDMVPFAQWVPVLVPLAAAPVALALQVGARVAWRLLREHEVSRRVRILGARPALVIGAGGPARQLVRSMLRDPRCRYVPVGFLAHDPELRARSLCGLPVLGTDDELDGALEATGCRLVVLAAPQLDARSAGALVQAALVAGVDVMTLPDAAELDRHTAHVSHLRDVVAVRPAKDVAELGVSTLQRLDEETVRWSSGANYLPYVRPGFNRVDPST